MPARGIIRKAALVAGAVAVGGLLLAGALLVFVNTRAGSSLVLERVLPRLDAAIAGSVTVERVRTSLRRLELTGVLLRDPEGVVVAEVARLEARFAPLALLRGRIELSQVTIERPELKLRADAHGLNLTRALAARGATDAESVAWTVVLERLALTGGRISFRSRTGERAWWIALEDLAANGEAQFDLAAGDGHGRVSVMGRQAAPYSAEVKLDLAATRADTAVTARIEAAVGGSGLVAQLRAPTAEEATTVVTLTSFRAAPALLRHLAPEVPLVTAISGHGTLTRRGNDVTAELEVHGGGATVTVDGRLDTARVHSPALHIEGARIDLAALVAGAPPSALAFTLDARGGGRTLASLTGELDLEVAPGRLAGRPFGPVRVRVRADDGRFALDELAARLPGATLIARGRASRRRLALSATVHAHSLAEAVRSFLPSNPPAIAGRGRVSAEIAGEWAAPTLTARGQFSRVRVQGQHARALTLRMRVPNLRRPWLASGRLHAGAATLATRQLGRLGLEVRTAAGRGFTARLTASGARPLAVRASGRWGPGFDALALHRLDLVYPGTTWHLRDPARIVVAPSLSIDGLTLASGNQRTIVTLRHDGRQLDGRVALRNLDLAGLPAFARPAGVVLAGRLDANVGFADVGDDPEVTVTGTLAGGQLGRLHGVSLAFAGRRGEHRLSGRFDARTAAGAMRADFDVPSALPPARQAPLDVNVEADHVDLRALLTTAGLTDAQIGGRARVSAHLAGTTAAPRLQMRVRVDDLTAGAQPVGAVDMLVTGHPTGPLTANLALRALGESGRAHVEMPLGLAQLLRAPPSAAELAAVPLRATAQFDAVPLAALGPFLGRAQLGGTATLDLDLRGPVRSPTGALHLAILGASAPGLPPTDAHLVLEARDSEAGLRGRLRVTRNQRTLASARARLALPAARLADADARARAPLSVEAQVGPVELQRLVAPADNDRRPPRVLAGRLAAALDVAGTLGAPRVAAHARIAGLNLAGAPLGDAELRVQYDERRPRLELRLDGADGGHVRLRAESRLDLDRPIATGRPRLRRVPISARLDARGYDLTPLSCLSDAVRVVEGRLDAAIDFEGTLARPRLRGHLAWRDGRFMVANAGDYRQIQLRLRGDEAGVVLEELSAHSAGGTARMTGAAQRAANGALALDARANLRRFPVHADGQRIAVITLAPHIRGSVNASAAELNVTIDEAHVELARGARGDLQSLQRPADVVLYHGEQPLNRAQAAKHAALVEARRALLRGHAAAPDPARPNADTTTSDNSAPLIRATVDAPNNLWVRGPDVNVELGLGPDFVVLARPEPAVFGRILVRRGQIDVIGRRFRIADDSSIRFNGPPTHPILRVRAVHEARHADMTVVVELSGPPEDPELDVRSPEHPEYGQGDLLAVVVTGRPPGEGADVSPSASAQAASLLGSFLAERVQRALLRRLPIDVLNIDPGDGLTGTQLEAGTYLGDDLYVAYVGRFGGEDPFLRENENELQLEYRLSRRWSFEAVYGDARRGSADLVWTRRY